MKYQRELAVSTHKATIIQLVWEIQVDSLLKLDSRRQKRTSDGSHEGCPDWWHFLFTFPQEGIS
jgi:hypothetical protein